MYNDTKDEASMDKGSNVTRIDTKDFSWSLAEEVKDQKNLVRFVSFDASKNQTVTIEVSRTFRRSMSGNGWSSFLMSLCTISEDYLMLLYILHYCISVIIYKCFYIIMSEVRVAKFGRVFDFLRFLNFYGAVCVLISVIHRHL